MALYWRFSSTKFWILNSNSRYGFQICSQMKIIITYFSVVTHCLRHILFHSLDICFWRFWERCFVLEKRVWITNYMRIAWKCFVRYWLRLGPATQAIDTFLCHLFALPCCCGLSLTTGAISASGIIGEPAMWLSGYSRGYCYLIVLCKALKSTTSPGLLQPLVSLTCSASTVCALQGWHLTFSGVRGTVFSFPCIAGIFYHHNLRLGDCCT